MPLVTGVGTNGILESKFLSETADRAAVLFLCARDIHSVGDEQRCNLNMACSGPTSFMSTGK
jgi:hypothetical protein